MTEAGPAPAIPAIRSVAAGEWPVVAWLWQAFRNDLATVLDSFPRPDGRYRHDLLARYPSPDRAGYLAWAPHPGTGDPAPVGFALVDGLGGPRRTIAALFVVPAARRGGWGRRLALETLRAHEGPWAVAFQHDNEAAARFWRAVADEAFGTTWDEEQLPVPGRPDVPADHWITSPLLDPVLPPPASRRAGER